MTSTGHDEGMAPEDRLSNFWLFVVPFRFCRYRDCPNPPPSNQGTSRGGGSVELGATVGEYPLAAASPRGDRREQHPAQEVGGRLGGVGRQQPCYPYEQAVSQAVVCQTFAHTFELPDVEGVQAHRLAGLVGGHMARLAVLRLPEGATGPLGKQVRRLHGGLFEHEQPLSPGGQSRASQGPLHGAGSHAQLPALLQISSDPARPPRRCAHRHTQDEPFGLRGQLHRPGRAWWGLGCTPSGP